jgi:hypothetical protein
VCECVCVCSCNIFLCYSELNCSSRFRILQVSVTTSAVHSMPPHEIAVSNCGSVASHGNGARARLQVAGRKVNGPQRGSRAEAEADLDRARQCASREEMATFLEQLRAGAGNSAVLHGDSEVQPAEPTEPCRKRQRTKGQPSTSVCQSAALSPGVSSSGLCRKEEDAPSRKAPAYPRRNQEDPELVRKSQGARMERAVGGNSAAVAFSFPSSQPVQPRASLAPYHRFVNRRSLRCSYALKPA